MESHLLTWRQRGRLWLRLGIRAALTAAAVLLLLFAVPPLLSLLSPFVLALLLAWALNPAVRWLKERLTLSRKTISLAVLLLAFGAVGGVCYGLGWALLRQLRSLFENWEAISGSLTATIDAVGAWLRRLGDLLPDGLVATGDDLVGALTGWLKDLDFDFGGRLSDMAGHATDFVSAVPGFAVASVVFLMASYFIVSDYPRLRYMVTDQCPQPLRTFCGQVRDIFMEAFGGYIKSELLLSLGVFFILTAGFFIIGQPYRLVLAFGLALLDFIPILGSGTVLVPWAVIDLITANYREAIGLMVIWGLVSLFRRFAEPKVLGDQTGLSPILSLLGIYVGMRLGGVPGMVLGPLLLLVCINLCKLGIFQPVAADLRLAVQDLRAILKGEETPEDGS